MRDYIEIYITELSKYFITAFIALYAFVCFIVVCKKREKRNNFDYALLTMLMFLVHFTCFISICFETGELDYLIFYGFQQGLLFATLLLFKVIYPKGNRLLINNVCMLLSIGFVILTRISFNKSVKQFFIVGISMVLCIFIPVLVAKLKLLKHLEWIYAFVGVAALSVVLVLGSITNGSKISYTIGGVTFQPSEFVKILFVFFLATAYAKANGILQVMLTAIIAGIHVLVLVASKDLGSALIFFMVYVTVTLVATRNPLYFIMGLGGGAAAALVAFQFFSHVQVRVQAWRDPWSVIDDAGYQITQSLFAISSGGLWGLGLFQGTPSTIPFVEADFVFSAVAEELGLIFCMCLIFICLLTYLEMMSISLNLRDKFYQLITFGLGVTYIFQVFLTIGGGTKFVPMTGITLPFISYGGSSVLTSLIMFFICVGTDLKLQDELYDIERNESKRK